MDRHLRTPPKKGTVKSGVLREPLALGDWLIYRSLFDLLEVSASQHKKEAGKILDVGFFSQGANRMHREAPEFILRCLSTKLGEPAATRLMSDSYRQFFSWSFRTCEHVQSVALGHFPPSLPGDLKAMSFKLSDRLLTDDLPRDRELVVDQLDVFAGERISRFFGLVGDGAAEKRRILAEYLYRREPRQRAIFIDYKIAKNYALFLRYLVEQCVGKPIAEADLHQSLSRYVRDNPVLLIVDNVDVVRSWNVAGYHSVRNDRITDLLVQITSPPAKAKVILCAPVLPNELTPYVGEQWRGHSALVNSSTIPEITGIALDGDRVQQGRRKLVRRMGEFTVPQVFWDCAEVIFRNSGKDLDVLVAEIERRFVRRSLGGVVKLMLDSLSPSNRCLLSYIAASEDGIRDLTLERIIGRDIGPPAFKGGDDAKGTGHDQWPLNTAQVKNAFKEALRPVVSKATDEDEESTNDVSAALRRSILFQWEKHAGLNEHKKQHDSFYSFGEKRKVHRNVAQYALELCDLTHRPRDRKDYVRLFQAVAHLISSVDRGNLENWQYTPVTNGEEARRVIAKSGVVDEVRLNFALYLLTEYLDPARHDGREPISTESSRLDLLTRLFYLGRSFPEAGDALNSSPLGLPAQLPFRPRLQRSRNQLVSAEGTDLLADSKSAESGAVQEQDKGKTARAVEGAILVDENHTELERSIYGQIAQCSTRTHRFALAKSALESALMRPPRPDRDLADLEFQVLRLDILIAQGLLSTALLLSEEIDVAITPVVQKLLDDWPRERQANELWFDMRQFVRFRARIAYLYLLRGQMRPAIETITGTCLHLQSNNNLLASFPYQVSSKFSFRVSERTVVAQGLGAQVLLRSVLREQVARQGDRQPVPTWLSTGLEQLKAARPSIDLPSEEAPEVTLDRYVRERRRWSAILSQAPAPHAAGMSSNGYQAAELHAFKERLSLLDTRLELSTLDGQVGPLSTMRLALERARNELFLYTRYRDLDAVAAADHHLSNALCVLQGLIDLAGMRRYPLFLGDALLLSVGARKEALACCKDAIARDLIAEGRLRYDQDRAHETLTAHGYSLRWLEYLRVARDFPTASRVISDFDIQLWG